GSEPGAAASSVMIASIVPTSTVSFSAMRISVRYLAVGDGTSESTLSVETSNNGSSASTRSPICFSQRVIVPSVTVSPSWGMFTSTRFFRRSSSRVLDLVEPPAGQGQGGLAEQLRQRRVQIHEPTDVLGRR